MSTAPVRPSTPARERPERLSELAGRFRPASLANEELLPTAAVFAELLGTPGLKRGSTIAVHGGRFPGATALLLALLVGPSASGSWCAVVGAPELGLVAASELGVALDRLVLVPEPGERVAAVAAALLEGCDLVCLRPSGPLAGSEARRLTARARERRAVLVVVSGSAAALAPAGAPAAPGMGAGQAGASKGVWNETPDVALTVIDGHFVGVEEGSGRITAHLVEVVAQRRRRAPEQVRRWLWLPRPDGRMAPADETMPAPLDLLGTGTT